MSTKYALATLANMRDTNHLIIIFFWPGVKPLVAQKLQKLTDMFGSAPYSGRSSSIKPSCSKTELNRCTTTEIRWNKKTKMLEHPRSSPPIACCPTRSRTEELLIGPWDFHHHFYYYYCYYYSRPTHEFHVNLVNLKKTFEIKVKLKEK